MNNTIINIPNNYNDYGAYIIPTSYNMTNYTTIYSNLNSSTYNHTTINNAIYTNHWSVVNREEVIIENINIPHVGVKSIPRNSSDVITFDDINDGDILIDFKRDSTKSEYDCGAYYKESTLRFILQSRKNQFTLLPIDIDSIVKYTAQI